MPGIRRPHKKSRAGCAQCKRRRIKCDEARPSCHNCTRNSAQCSYLPASSKLPGLEVGSLSKESNIPPFGAHIPGAPTNRAPTPVASTPGAPTPGAPILSSPPSSPSFITTSRESIIQDLELLHFYTTSTCFTLSNLQERCRIWQYNVPQIAFSHEFLLHGLLALSALHLSRQQFDRKSSLYAAASMHHDIALASFRSTMSCITPQNCHACFAFSSLVVIHAWASSNGKGDLFFKGPSNHMDVDGTVEWVGLLRGVSSILKTHYDWVLQGPLGKLLDIGDQKGMGAETSLEDSARFAALERSWDITFTALDVGEDETLSRTLVWLMKIYGTISSPNNKLDTAAAVLSWPARVPEAYFQMLNNRQPQALILLAHYCLLLNKIDSFWWMRGMSRYLLQTIHRTLGKEWESWIAWPLQDLVLSEFRNEAR